MRFVYTGLAYLAVPLVCAILLARGFRDRRYWQKFTERFGFGTRLVRASIWVHVASVGEVQAAAPLVFHLSAHFPTHSIVVTTFTLTGANRAREIFKQHAQVRYLPFDLPGSVHRFFDRIEPRIAVILETELWPNLYRECGRRQIPLVIASARIAPRSVHYYRKLLGTFKEALLHVTVLAAQSEEDAARFRSLGADPATTHVMGNIKFDFSVAADVCVRARALRERYAASRATWIAGSTHEGEEKAVIEAHQQIQRKHPQALLILAPRHPQRFHEVANWLSGVGIRFARRSRGEMCSTDTEVLLIDTLGELVDFYAAADVAFVGGSLTPIGGHNLLEPAALGLPVLTGPYNFNSEGVARILLDRGAVEIVRDAAELGARVAWLLEDVAARTRIGTLARAAVEDNRGALIRLLALIEPLLRATASISSRIQ